SFPAACPDRAVSSRGGGLGGGKFGIPAVSAAQVPAASARPDIRQRIRRIERRQALRDLALILPLVAFLLLIFAAPIAGFMWRVIDNEIVPRHLPRTAAAMAAWARPGLPPDGVFDALAQDLKALPADGNIAILGRHLNATREGFRSLMLKTANKLPDAPEGTWRETLVKIDKKWA